MADTVEYKDEEVSVLVNESRAAASHIVTTHGNFVHDPLHIAAVEQNVVYLGTQAKLAEYELFLLRVAAHWHDTGRHDGESEETIPHQELSIQEFCLWAQQRALTQAFQTRVKNIIGQHRHRRATQDIDDPLARILWDADKLDILNLDRCRRILAIYQQGKNNPRSEFNYQDTLAFWRSLGPSFEAKFHTPMARKIFVNAFKDFQNFIASLPNSPAVGNCE